MPSALCDILAHEFTPSARTKGDVYARLERVRIVAGSAKAVDAQVVGSRAYTIEIASRERDGDVTIDASCDCPYAEEHVAPCKHLWATLRAAHAAGYLADADGGRGRTFLNVVPADAAIDVGAPDEEAESEHALQPPPRLSNTTRRVLSAGMRRFWAKRAGSAPARRPAQPPARPDPGTQFLTTVEAHVRARDGAPPPAFRYASADLLYAFAPAPAGGNGHVRLHVMTRGRKKNGDWSVPKAAVLSKADIASAPDDDRRILAALGGAAREAESWSYGAYGDTAARQLSYSGLGALAADLIPRIAATGRACLQTSRLAAARPPRPWSSTSPYETVYTPLAWDDGPPWRFVPSLTPTPRGWRVHGWLGRGDARLDLVDIVAIDDGFVWTQTSVARADIASDAVLITQLAAGPVDVAADHAPRLSLLLSQVGVDAAFVPTDLRVESVDVAPRPRLTLSPSAATHEARLDAALSFDYDGSVVSMDLAGSAPVFDAAHRRMIRRRAADEAAAHARILALGVRPVWDAYAQRQQLSVVPRQVAPLVSALLSDGWHVEGATGAYRAAGAVRLSVTSGVDWFDLDAIVAFEDETIPLPDVLAALGRREQTIRLGDGSIGVLPEDWLRRYLPLAAAGETIDGRLRFRSPQAALLDALLDDATAHAAIDIDDGFRRARDELANFGRAAMVDPPPSFAGLLRDYQREGLAWLQFLDRAGFGGCLADDMGLGKTVMVLAMLAARREAATELHRPSLVVVPRSLVHNWIAEAARFTPSLSVIDFSATGRASTLDFAEADVVLITYGTLRRDILRLKEEAFDYVILDEAQAIKNAGTASAKAARLLRGRRRLALTGTPIENHLGELWSLFEFLNPGVLGRSSLFQRAAAASPDAETTGLIARGLRPFLLRRTKQQVARELPARTEQTITCELSKPERALYESLRRHYRQSVLARVEARGMKGAQMHILEALLRLRQAACHPSLVDRTREYATSAKLDTLMANVKEVIASGHKALVFSQFTSLLALVRRELDAGGLTYEYLDGRTRDRGRKVAHFQDDPTCRLFLISLKAGGLGLNLTAAGYVFLLDPWWNPAVEAQAIDRAHRIGQTREVFAYRLVAGDTIETKILDLQARKRALADAILSTSGGLTELTRSDLELLLT